ncbi:FG-GAP-like repeat-containing protein [Hymenobacter sp. GOD-10R]|uniref:FG-GAP-like repeat-containing protein n=1 Tax=Hymenobacter sp. GOD-10R TaxID=3093922 RepID=UPI002D79BD1A|nr:FG-GAP-like repeat-containing protein [Hymenobacter sp. GOD-10R]WRQ31319.1 FG-GAP-like repeat-containing protein [Hymenobacter sp. GOD-10R]
MIYSTTPAAHQVGVARNTNVAAAFSYTLGNNATVQAATKVFSQQVGGKRSGITTINSNILTFNPDADFKAGERVSATFTKDIQRETGENLVIPRVLQFITATSPSTGTFGGGSEATVANRNLSQNVVTGDLDGDGDVDLASVSTSRSVSVRFNNGTGSFSGSTEVALNPDLSARRVALADLDNDGDLDLLTVGSNSSEKGFLSVRLNNGQGSFTAVPDVSVGDGAQNLAVGDVNGDGYLDVLTANSPSRPGTVSVRLNNGDGTFAPAGGDALVYIANRPFDIKLGDIDQDGDLDMVTSNLGSVTVFRNSGTGSFTTGQQIAIASSPFQYSSSLDLGDIDQDGDLDFVAGIGVGSQATSAIAAVGLNNGGTFTLGQQFGVNSFDISLGDIDGDQDLDFVAASGTRLNNGQGTFGAPTPLPIGDTSALTISYLSDVDNDGDLDVLTGNEGTQLSVRLNQNLLTPPLAVTSFTPARNTVAAPRSADVAVTFNQALSNTATTQGTLKVYSQQAGGLKMGIANVTGSTLTFNPTADFKAGETIFASILTAFQSSNGQSLAKGQVFQFTTITAPSTGTFSGGSEVTVGTNPTGSTTGDLDGDGDLDLAVQNSSSGSISIRLNNGNGTFTGGQEINGGSSVILADVDGDSDLDLLAPNATVGTSVLVYLNNGSGSFSLYQTATVLAGVTDIAVGDVDADGDLDLITTAYGFRPGNASVRLNDGTGNFRGGQDINSNVDRTYNVAVGDVDGDGDLDFVMGNASANPGSVPLNAVTIYSNNGSGTFDNGQLISLGSGGGATDVALGDLDKDGDLDFVSTNGGSTQVAVGLNNGNGTFTTRQFAANMQLGSVSLGDVDGDGDLDFVTSTETGTLVWVNNGAASFSTTQTVAAVRSAILSDIDGDGDLDLLGPDGPAGSNTFGIRLNQNAASTLRTPENPANAVAGLNYQYYEGFWSAVPDYSTLTPARTGMVATPTLSEAQREDGYAFQYTGYVTVPTDGQYTFYTSSDDGSKLFIGSQLVVDNDGLHGEVEQSGTIGLQAGTHAVTIAFFENDGGQTLNVSYAGPSLGKQLIPATAYKRVSTTANQAPVANAGANQSLTLPTNAVTLNGSGTDADGSIATYAWTQVSGPNTATFSNTTVAQPTVSNLVAGTYVFSLVVTDNLGAPSAAAQTTVTVNAANNSDLRTPENPANTVAGLDYKYYEGFWDAVPDYSTLTPLKTGTTTAFELTAQQRDYAFSFQFTGYVTVPADGQYTFYSNSDDGSLLYIGNTLVVNNDGSHGDRELSGTIGLKAGTHAFTVSYLQGYGGQNLQVSYAGPSLAKQLLPASALKRVAGTASNLRVPENPANAVAGLDYQYYEGYWNTLPTFSALTPAKTGTVASPVLTPALRDDGYAFQYTGYVTVPTDGQYTFYTTSDDGSKLSIGSQLVVDNDGLHGDVEQSGTIGLQAGTHALTIAFFENDGGQNLQVSYAGPSLGKQLIPATAYKRVAGTANQAPVANAGTNRSLTLPTNSVVLSGSATDADGTIAAYLWSQVSGPSTASFSNTTVVQPTMSNLVAGSYVFGLVATDNQGATSAQTQVTVTVNTANNLRVPENPTGTVAGLDYQYYEGFWDVLPNFAGLTPLQSGSSPVINLEARQRDYGYAFQYTGYVTVPTDGQYTFYTSSDDGSTLYIGSTLVVDNDGSHDTQERSGTIGLQAGTHAFTVTYFQNGGGQVFSASYQGPGLAKQVIPAEALRRVTGAAKSVVATTASATSPGSVSERTGRNTLEVYPNPLTEGGTVHFRTRQGGKAQVYLYDELGHLIATVYNAEVVSGAEYYLPLSTEKLASGVYICRLISNGKVENLRLTVIR